MANIKAKIKDTPDLSVEGLAKRLGKSAPQTYRILNGKSPYQPRYTRILREYVGIGPRMDREGNQMAVIDLVDLSDVHCFEGEKDIICRLTLPEGMLPERIDQRAIKLVKVPGDHCAPDYKPGEYIFVDTSKRMPEPPGVFLFWSGAGYKLQFCEHIFGSKPAMIRLFSTNKAVEYAITEAPLDGTSIIGRVFGKISIPPM